MDIIKIIITNTIFLGALSILAKFYFDNKLEKLKVDLQLKFTNEQERINQKRMVYINLINTMAIFIGSRVSQEEQPQYKTNFLKAYDIAWLWASDEVLKSLSIYLQFNMEKDKRVEQSSDDEKIEIQREEKELFVNCILSMRKDIGFLDSSLDVGLYKFVNF